MSPTVTTTSENPTAPGPDTKYEPSSPVPTSRATPFFRKPKTTRPPLITVPAPASVDLGIDLLRLVPITPEVLYKRHRVPYGDLRDWDASSPSPTGCGGGSGYPESPFDFSVGMQSAEPVLIPDFEEGERKKKKLVGLGLKDFSIGEGMSTITPSRALVCYTDTSLLFYTRISE